MFSQIGSVGFGVGLHQAQRFETKSTPNYVTTPGGGYFEHIYEPLEVNSIGGVISGYGNISFIGWLINNRWNDLERGFYIGDYFSTSFGFGPYREKRDGVDPVVDMQLLASFGLGIQAGYKIPNLPDLASVEFRWYLNGAVNNIRTYGNRGGSYDDLLNVGLTGRYGSYSVRMDYGYRHNKPHTQSWEMNAKSFSMGCNYFLDRSKKYTPSSFNAGIGIRYEGFYNFYLNNYRPGAYELNGRNHSLAFELILMKF